ncbi:uncharacterized protein TRIVIDRAFT_225578 [Trichoderma virens Gv29-8]|uniref:Transmembrane protein n=1 Tax=Hypocrea virens (strain Gv29-8 / FGSC 10586) TaxID=413071 RepID=G9N3S8_HYPVG|nr:uncharacterized protein TRIVIDRAFT_225578 [Trichoderma virens Gv29-8]EHK18257.1 hypothetical protein TRIVIDRAFT_225578 [Trichoderma virens Gv29-8]UKZ52474.1 hypothetical protein TrVGV298_006251 [Trichoderma virens]
MVFLVCWKEVCIRGLHLWLKDGFHWPFYGLFIFRVIATHVAVSVSGRRCRQCKKMEEEEEMEELLEMLEKDI